ncbi:hypothetical protein BH24ACI5_BH24ACI5_19840 [soil metagenome]
MSRLRLSYNQSPRLWIQTRMPIVIEPGMAVSHYQIAGRLGAGGMGEVCKALDTTLGHTVALKILPPHLVRHEVRTRRFVQEARSALTTFRCRGPVSSPAPPGPHGVVLGRGADP